MSKKKQVFSEERFARQRKKWGFDERELYSLDHTIAEFVLPRLKVFAKTFDKRPVGTTLRRWKNDLALMIFAFAMVVQDRVVCSSKKDFAKFEKGMRAFADNFTALWN